MFPSKPSFLNLMTLDCTTLYIYEGLNQVIETYLKGISLQDILNREQSFDYVI